MTDLVGQILGNYKLVKLLGKGGYAKVYKGEHVHLGTYAAVKVLDATITGEEIDKFRKEARIIANLHHPNILRVLDFDIQGRTPFLVMEYAPKRSLQELRPNGRSFPYITVVSYIKQIATALQYAHDHRGLIHRDVKPANMLILDDDRIVLSDFGIALIAQSGLQDTVGTASYMAPEQIQGHAVLASDQYALGIVAYEWLSGTLPFTGTPQEVCLQHLSVPPPSLNGKIPANVEKVIIRSLEKHSQQRFPRVLDFAEELEKAYQDAAQAAQGTTGPVSSETPFMFMPTSHPDSTTIFFSGHAFQPMDSAGELISRYDELLKEFHLLNIDYKKALQDIQDRFAEERKGIEADLREEQDRAKRGIEGVREAVSRTQESLTRSGWNSVVKRTVIPSTPTPSSLELMTASQRNALDASRKIASLVDKYRERAGYYKIALTIIVVVVVVIAILYGLYAVLVAVVQIFGQHWTLLEMSALLSIVAIVVLLLLLMGLLWLRDKNATAQSIKTAYVQLMQASSAVETISGKQKEALENSRNERVADLQMRSTREIETTDQKLRTFLNKLTPKLTKYLQEDGFVVAGWDDAQWQRWQPLQFPISLARLGVMAESASFPPVPALAICPGRDNILFKAPSAVKEKAIQALRALMLRLLTAQLPGKLRFILIDPTGLGDSVSAFLRMAEYDDQLISGTVWTEKEEIAQQLAELSNHMKNVIQQYLRDQYATIDEYNKIAGEIAEPYRILVVVGFPTGFNKEIADRLVQIAEAGPRCGVSVLMTVDTEQKVPSSFNLAELERKTRVIAWENQRFTWQHKDIGSIELQLDVTPRQELFEQLLQRVGEKAREARQRVEIPFRVAIERGVIPEYRWWANDQTTIEEFASPLGRMGATKYQYLRLGRLTVHHVLIVGRTDSGKTNLLHVLIMGLSLIYHPDELEFYLIDFKSVGFTPYANYKLPHAHVVVTQSDRELGLNVLEGLKEELEERMRLFSEVEAHDFTQFRKLKPQVRMPRILLIVDEFQELFTQQDDIAGKAAAHLDRFVRRARGFGIHVILSSQTLAGTAAPGRPTIDSYPTILDKSTVSQMTVRIALKNNEDDSHLILDKNNTLASLLKSFRQGQAVYNAESGAETGNSRFQAFWLAAEELPVYLDSIRQLARHHRYVPARPQIIFDGKKNANANENRELNALLSSSEWLVQPSATIWLGKPISLKAPTGIQLRSGRGNNLLVIGQDENATLGLGTIALFTLMAQYSPRSVQFYIIDGRSDTSIGGGSGTSYLERLRERERRLPHMIKTDKYDKVPLYLTEINNKIKERIATRTIQKLPIYLFIYDLQDISELRSGGVNTSANLSRQLVTILRDGPEQNIHTLIWCDQYSNFTRVVESSMLREFGQRIAFQMAEGDSVKFTGSKEASRLGSHRALLFKEAASTLEKFVPYERPSDEWLKQALEHLHQKR